ncbi:MAG: sigma-54-dependent Fis family transcriptional regulator [Planctomycetes bacterium]|nr:sigma-54-dependent Fis family transcriptional regulator [Planctomycetota bacterium]
MNPTKVLIIEDEQLIRWSLTKRFGAEGYLSDEAENGGKGLALFGNSSYDLVMLDYKLPDMNGIEVLRRIRERDPDVVVILMTAFGTVETAVDAMKLGAYDFVSKPFQMDALMLQVERGLETTRLKRQVRDYRESVKTQYGFDQLIGQSAKMKEIYELILDVASSGAATIFLLGETGTGKDLVAKTIHYNSDRADHPFINITCTALSESLLESELFGHEKGAFTDAKSQKKGLFELATGGTAFLDEVGDMLPALQAKLLRFLEEKTFRRVGGVQDITVDVRIIAATNRDIQQAVAERAFREDLYHRLNVITIELPPLRDRDGDLERLARHFVDAYCREYRKNITEIEQGAFDRLRSYSWPGNVRELRNTIERAVILSKSETLTASDFVIGRQDESSSFNLRGLHLPPDGVDLHDVEAELVRQALQRTTRNQTKAAKLLGLSRDQLRYRMEKLGLLHSNTRP